MYKKKHVLRALKCLKNEKKVCRNWLILVIFHFEQKKRDFLQFLTNFMGQKCNVFQIRLYAIILNSACRTGEFKKIIKQLVFRVNWSYFFKA